MCPDLLPVESYMISGREGMFVQLQQRGFFFSMQNWVVAAPKSNLCIFIQSVLQTIVEHDLQ